MGRARENGDGRRREDKGEGERVREGMGIKGREEAEGGREGRQRTRL